MYLIFFPNQAILKQITFPYLITVVLVKISTEENILLQKNNKLFFV